MHPLLYQAAGKQKSPPVRAPPPSLGDLARGTGAGLGGEIRLPSPEVDGWGMG